MSVLKSIVQQHSSNSFQPTDAHRKAKTAFWSHFFQTGETAPESIEAAAAARLSGFNEVVQWYEIPGFREWFSNGEEFRQRVEYVSNLALDFIQETLQDRNARPGDKMQAAKMALEVASKFPKSAPKEQVLDEKIAEMDRKQLEEFIANKLTRVRIPLTTKEVDTEDDSTVN